MRTLGAVTKLVDRKLLRGLAPLNALNPQHFNEISAKVVVEEYPPGKVIVKEGERDPHTLYLIAGEVVLFTGTAVAGHLDAREEQARHPLVPQLPRRYTIKSKTRITLARLDTGLLDMLLGWDQSQGFEVGVLEGCGSDDDWLSRMLQSQAFQKLPPANIQKLLLSMEEVVAEAGQAIIQQGEPGDYFYIVKEGRCRVTRHASAGAEETTLAELEAGASFGEDALISEKRRNATVTLLTPGKLMRLSKADFHALLKDPLLSSVSFKQAQALVEQGGRWLDVRLPGEYQSSALPGSLNIPLVALRHQLGELERGRSYVVCCDNGERSATAAFVLGQRGFQVHVLAGGLQETPTEPGEPVANVVRIEDHTAPALDKRRRGEDRIQELEQMLAAAQARIESLQVQQTERERDGLHALEAVEDEHQAVLASLEAELQTALSALEAARTDSAQQSETLAALNARVVQLSEASAEADARCVALDTALAEMQSAQQAEVELMRAALDAGHAAQTRLLEEAHQAHEQTRSELAALRSAHELQQQASAEQEAVLEQERASWRERQAEAERRFQREHTALTARIAVHEEALAQATAATEAARIRIAALEDASSERERAVADASAAQAEVLAALSVQLDQAEKERTALGEQLAQAGQASSEQRAEDEERLAVALAEIERLTLDLGGAEAQAAALQAELAASRDQQSHDLEAAQNQCAALVVRLDEAQAVHAALRAEHEALTEAGTAQASAQYQEIDRLQLALDEAGTRAVQEQQALATQLASLITEGEAALERLASEHAQVLATREREVQSLASEIETLRTQLAQGDREAQAEAARLADENTKLQAQIADLQPRAKEAQRVRDDLRAQAEAYTVSVHNAQRERDEAYARLEAQQRARERAEEGREGFIAALERADQQATVAMAQAEEALQSLIAKEAARAELESKLAELQSTLADAESDRGATLARQVEEQQALRLRLAEAEALAHEAQAMVGGMKDERDAAQRLAAERLSAQQAAAEEAAERLAAAEDAAHRALTASAAAERKAEEQGQLRQAAEAAKKSAQQMADALRMELAAAREYGSEAVPVPDPQLQQQIQSLETELEQARQNTELAVRLRSEAEAARSTAEKDLPALREQAQLAQTQLRHQQAISEEARARIAELEQQARGSGAHKMIWLGSAALGWAFSLALVVWLMLRPAPAPPPAVSATGAITPAAIVAPVAAIAPGRRFQDRLADGGSAPRMVEVAAGQFQMGSIANSLNSDEVPRHDVSLPAFAMSQHEVSFTEYSRFARATGRALPKKQAAGQGELPVAGVSWHDAQAYARWVSEQTGKRYRLPSEAEWEYAANAGKTSFYWWGNNVAGGHANCFDCGSRWDRQSPAPIGSFAANPFGLHDTSGNVAEWVQDCHHANYQGAPADGRAWQEEECLERVVRGGAFDSPSANLRTQRRAHFDAQTRLNNLGFRLAMDL